MSRCRFAKGLTEEHLIHPPLHEGLGEMRNPVGLLLTLERAMGGCGDVAAEAQLHRALR